MAALREVLLDFEMVGLTDVSWVDTRAAGSELSRVAQKVVVVAVCLVEELGNR